MCLGKEKENEENTPINLGIRKLFQSLSLRMANKCSFALIPHYDSNDNTTGIPLWVISFSGICQEKKSFGKGKPFWG